MKNGRRHAHGFPRPVKIIATILFRIMPLLWRKTIVMAIYLGYWPKIKRPRTFNEKIAHLQLLEYDPRFQVLADKWEVRGYVSDVVGKQYLTEVFAVMSSASELNLDKLPDRFVAKPNHLSGEIYFISDKRSLDYRDFVRTLHLWLSSTHGIFHGEYWYAQIPPRIIIEEWLSNKGQDVPFDIKFYVFHGRVEFIQIDLNRFSRQTKTLYTREWRELAVEYVFPHDPDTGFARPARTDEMISVAEALGQEFDFVRVDLYCLDDSRIVFGEMTFNPNSGNGRFKPRKFDFEFGDLW